MPVIVSGFGADVQGRDAERERVLTDPRQPAGFYQALRHDLTRVKVRAARGKKTEQAHRLRRCH
jgi:hypothetical protein